jgi:hypothetical protein
LSDQPALVLQALQWLPEQRRREVIEGLIAISSMLRYSSNHPNFDISKLIDDIITSMEGEIDLHYLVAMLRSLLFREGSQVILEAGRILEGVIAAVVEFDLEAAAIAHDTDEQVDGRSLAVSSVSDENHHENSTQPVLQTVLKILKKIRLAICKLLTGLTESLRILLVSRTTAEDEQQSNRAAEEASLDNSSSLNYSSIRSSSPSSVEEFGFIV